MSKRTHDDATVFRASIGKPPEDLEQLRTLEPLLLSALNFVRLRLRERGALPVDGTELDQLVVDRLQRIPPADTDTNFQ